MVFVSEATPETSIEFMKILVVTNLFPNPYQPNIATFNRQQFSALAETHEIRVIAPISWTIEMRERKKQGVKLNADRISDCDGLSIQHPRFVFTPKIFRGWYGHFYQKSIQNIFARNVREFQPDLVFATWCYPDGWAAINLAREYGLPVVLKLHGSDIHDLPRPSLRFNRTLDALRRADAVVTVSRDMGQSVSAYGVDTEKIHTVYNGIERELFSTGNKLIVREKLNLSPDRKLLMWVGRMVSVKGLDIFLKSLRILKDQKVDVTAVLIGSGPLEDKLKREAETLGITENVEFRGNIDHDHLPDWYRAADLTVLPSLSEGIPNVLLESISCGTPFVASRVGGIPEIATESIDQLVSSENPQELARAIRGSLERDRSKDPGRRFEPMDWATSANQLAEVFESAIDRTNAISSAV